MVAAATPLAFAMAMTTGVARRRRLVHSRRRQQPEFPQSGQAHPVPTRIWPTKGALCAW